MRWTLGTATLGAAAKAACSTLRAHRDGDRTIRAVPIDRRALIDDLAYVRLAEGVIEAERRGRTVSDERNEALRYGKGWSAFWNWCEHHGHGGEAFPVTIGALVDWLAWAAEELPERDIERSLAAVRQRHIDAGFAAHIEGFGG